MSQKTNNSKRFKVRWGKCGDYDEIEKIFYSLDSAKKYYADTSKEESNIWIELCEILQHNYCDEQKGEQDG